MRFTLETIKAVAICPKCSLFSAPRREDQNAATPAIHMLKISVEYVVQHLHCLPHYEINSQRKR